MIGKIATGESRGYARRRVQRGGSNGQAWREGPRRSHDAGTSGGDCQGGSSEAVGQMIACGVAFSVIN
jgi:hypothetical protein